MTVMPSARFLLTCCLSRFKALSGFAPASYFTALVPRRLVRSSVGAAKRSVPAGGAARLDPALGQDDVGLGNRAVSLCDEAGGFSVRGRSEERGTLTIKSQKPKTGFARTSRMPYCRLPCQRAVDEIQAVPDLRRELLGWRRGSWYPLHTGNAFQQQAQ